MATHRIKIGVLTSSRADFGIYLPLLKKMNENSYLQLELIVFGSHLSKFHGFTVSEIEAQGFEPRYKLDTLMSGDTPEAIATSMALCMMKFAQFWGAYSDKFDVVFCLGDRYEMFAAVSAGGPFGIRFAHLHGGEQTLGAIDNFFRHAISHQSWCHFVSTEASVDRLKEMLDSKERIFYVGALSLDSLADIKLLSREQLTEKFDIHFDKSVVLVTFHPETVDFKNSERYAQELIKLMYNMRHVNFVVSLPNADTSGNIIRMQFINKLSKLAHVKLTEGLGSLGYFSLMRHGQLLLGNSSSGIIEAASFGKYVINVGDRQKGRLQSENTINVPVQYKAMKEAIEKTIEKGEYTGKNIYFKGGTSDLIINNLIQCLTIHGNQGK